MSNRRGDKRRKRKIRSKRRKRRYNTDKGQFKGALRDSKIVGTEIEKKFKKYFQSNYSEYDRSYMDYTQILLIANDWWDVHQPSA